MGKEASSRQDGEPRVASRPPLFVFRTPAGQRQPGHRPLHGRNRPDPAAPGAIGSLRRDDRRLRPPGSRHCRLPRPDRGQGTAADQPATSTRRR